MGLSSMVVGLQVIISIVTLIITPVTKSRDPLSTGCAEDAGAASPEVFHLNTEAPLQQPQAGDQDTLHPKPLQPPLRGPFKTRFYS